MRRGALLALVGLAGAAVYLFARPAAAAVASVAETARDGIMDALDIDHYFSPASGSLMFPNVGPVPASQLRANETAFLPTIRAAEKTYSIPPRLLQALLWRESRFADHIVSGRIKSRTGAVGVAQFMPATAARFGVDPYNPESSINGAGAYLRVLFDEFQDWKKAVAGYNAGEGAVRKYQGVPPFPETREYVAEILPNAGLA